MEKVLLSIPFIVGIFVFGMTYWWVMHWAGMFATMLLGPIIGLLGAIVAFLIANYIVETIRYSND